MRWYAMDTQFLADPKIEELGEKHGPAGPLVIVSLLGHAGLSNRGGRIEKTYRTVANETFTEPAEVARIIKDAADTGVLAIETQDDRSFIGRFPAWERYQAAFRQARARTSKKGHQQADVTPRHAESRPVTESHNNKTGQDSTKQDKTEQTAKKGSVADRATAPLSHLLADLIAENGGRRPRIGQSWLEAERLLLQRDQRDGMQAEALIRWCQKHEFWRANILSMPKFRQQYDRLRLTAEGESKGKSRGMAQAHRFADMARKAEAEEGAA